ncbi:zinc finger protein [Phlyctema vagabunda]|uniref:Zinc finger protein n=1 Tax=Phlyctema vagabunda TaxID=108571 RepID=A0ABR4PPD9_9HELO
MSGIGEAGLALGIVSSIISIVTAAKDVYEAANNATGLPKAFDGAAAKFPLILILMDEATTYLQRSDVDPKICKAIRRVLEPCEKSSNDLFEIFDGVVSTPGISKKWDRYWNAARKLGKGGRVESLIGDILQNLNLLSTFFAFPESIQRELNKARNEVSMMGPSLPDNFVATSLTMPSFQTLETRHHIDQKQSSASKLRPWILPESLGAPDFVFDQTFHYDKIFQNPETGYETCNWIFQTRAYFNINNAKTPSILWIKGAAGSGKSVICASIINRIQSKNNTKRAHILYCYGHCDLAPLTSMTLVRVLLAQVIQWDISEIILEIEMFYKLNQVLKEYDSILEEEVWNLLSRILKLVNEKIFMVIDGLQECAQPLVTAKFLVTLATKLAPTNSISLIVSSRFDSQLVFQNQSLKTRLNGCSIKASQVEITQQQNSEDLKQFITYKVAVHPSFFSTSDKIKERFIDGVLTRADGMFLFASLVLDDLKRDNILSIAAVDATLAKIPNRLPEIYESYLKIPRHSRKGEETLSWIIHSFSYLTWHELQSGLAIVDSGFSEDEIIQDTCQDFIQHSCGPLVECFGEKIEYLRFIHPTVNEFLRDNSHLRHNSQEETSVNIQGGHSMLASKLLTFLDHDDLPDYSPFDEEPPLSIIQSYTQQTGYGIYYYATFNWYKHLKECDKSVNSVLEEKVLGFLMSTSAVIRWLKSTLIMVDASRDGKDSSSVTADVIDSLQGWVQGKTWSNPQSPVLVQSWIKGFLELMLDWGKVLELQPYWIHYLHHQLLPEGNYFRNLLDEDGDHSIIQFRPEKIISKSSAAVTWPERCFAVDINRDLAFTYDEPFISCYHMRTSMFTADFSIDKADDITGPLILRKGMICPQNRYLAIMFEATEAITDPISSNIRGGQQLQLNFLGVNEKPLAWKLEHESDLCQTPIIAEMLGIQRTKVVVCLFELHHEGPARTHLFRFPKWATTPILETGSQIIKWTLDDIDALNFSPDSTKLATPFGVFDLSSGHKESRWTFHNDPFLKGGKVTVDFTTFVTVQRQFADSVLKLYSLKAENKEEFEFPGIVHILAVSNHGRFHLLLRVQTFKGRVVRVSKGPTPQEGNIGVFDCEKKSWTPLLILEPPTSKRQASWNLANYEFQPQFSPEAQGKKAVNKVLCYIPKGWKLANNVRCSSQIDPKHDLILQFEAEKFVNGFGKNPSLKLQIPINSQRWVIAQFRGSD